MIKKEKKRIYWDTASGTSGNPASIHRDGVLANKMVMEAREKIAKILYAHSDEIIFTGSGTESDNLAILGLAELTTKKHLITSEIEHKAVLEPIHHLQKKGFRVTYLPVDEKGQVKLEEFKKSLIKETFLVSVMVANNEIGAIQPIREIAKIIRHFRKINNSKLPYLHTDACQAPRFLDLNVEKLGVDLLSFNSSKIYGPEGVGALFVRRGVILAPVILGGGQERGLRSGTLNTSGIVGFAKALEVCEKMREKESLRLSKLRDKLISELNKISELTINGGLEKRLPNNVNFSIAGFEGEQLVLELDAKGIAVSSGSACSSTDSINNNVRISFDREATIAGVNYFMKSLKEILQKYNNLCYNQKK